MKIQSPIDVTKHGIVMVVREKQPQKTPSQRDFTESGILMMVREEQLSKTS